MPGIYASMHVHCDLRSAVCGMRNPNRPARVGHGGSPGQVWVEPGIEAEAGAGQKGWVRLVARLAWNLARTELFSSSPVAQRMQGRPFGLQLKIPKKYQSRREKENGRHRRGYVALRLTIHPVL